MGFKPGDFFVGIVQLFGVLIPGYFVLYLWTENSTTWNLDLGPASLALAYVIGHFVRVCSGVLNQLYHRFYRPRKGAKVRELAESVQLRQSPAIANGFLIRQPEVEDALAELSVDGDVDLSRVVLYEAESVARAEGLNNVYVYADQGCDCAGDNLPAETYLDDAPESVNAVKKCSASCCDDSGVLLKKYEQGRA